MRIRPFSFCIAACTLALLLTSCSTGKPARRGTPAFLSPMPMPIGIRLIDGRSEQEALGGRQKDGFYPSIPRAQQLSSFTQDLGNALSGYSAVQQWYVLRPEQDISRHALTLEVELNHWYARWPVDVKRDETHVLVDGVCEARWKLRRNGRVVLKGKHEDGLEPLPVHLSVIRSDTVARVIRESLLHQMQHSKRRWIEAALLDMADHWEKVLKSGK